MLKPRDLGAKEGAGSSRLEPRGAGQRYAFGPFELDPAERSLSCRGRACRIQPQPLRILVLLVSRPNCLTTRQELRREIWGDDVAVDHEHGLNFAINQIRSVLGDSAKAPTYVETVPRAGYRFIAPVRRLPPPDPTTVLRRDVEATASEATSSSRPGPSEAPESDESGIRKQAWVTGARALPHVGRGLAGALGVIIALLLVALALRPSTPRKNTTTEHAATAPTPIRLAVLPFESVETDPALAKGLTFDLITSLGQLAPRHRLEVVGHRSVMQFRDSDQPLLELARRLGADFVLEGQIAGNGDGIRIRTMLIGIPEGTVRWSTFSDLAPREILVTRRSLAVQIVRSLLEDPVREDSPTVSVLPLDPDVYGRFAEARWQLASGSGPPWEAIDALREVARQAPSFALGQATLASALATNSFGSDQLALPEAAEAAERALALDPRSSEALFALGMLRAYADRDYRAGRDLLARALELEPSNAVVLSAQAGLLTVLGDSTTAARMTDLAVKLDPLSGNAWVDAGYADYLGRRFALSRDRCRRALELGCSSRFWAASCLLGSSQEAGDADAMEQAISYFLTDSDADELQSGEGPILDRVHILRQRIVRDLQTANGTRVFDYLIATHTAALDLPEETLGHLEAAERRGDLFLPFALVDPAFEALGDHPRFRSLEARLRSSRSGRSSPQRPTTNLSPAATSSR